ncbi:cupin domain-containing protein [Kribbella sp. HUAS MG21]|jgi:quercetin dioxygenase-like cupin family protein|uniref:Cupin domain-containing protein n=1 Tax=Kribbella sp. HUAS MG21 TaxID=3160966 RepID=A0AAU7TD82_9ACTN
MSGRIRPSGSAVISSPETQTALWFLGVLQQLRVSGEQTGGAFSLTDNLARRGSGSPVHIHEHEEESLIVLDGNLRVVLDGEDHPAGPGTVAILPQGVPHAYVVTSAEARFLTLHNPAGFERFAAEVGEPAQALTLPPDPADAPDLAAVAAVAARHGITILGPPPRV